MNVVTSGAYKHFIICILIAFLIAMVIGPPLIKMLTEFKFGQNVRDDGPKSHLKKMGTPTIGGLIILIPLTIVTLIFSREREAMLLLFSTVGFGAIGLIDDYIKVAKKRSLGLKAYQKIILQFFVSAVLAVMAARMVGTSILVPFTKGFLWDLGVLYVPLMICPVIIGTVNSVNLTDGLDGLASTITIIVTGFFAIIALTRRDASSLVFCGALTGALLGFIRYNSYPAQIFMGDTGSLALGGAVVALALVMRMPIFLIIVGLIYVLEAISVMIQVVYFKLTKGKRFFKMAPLHHHFELSGWMETKVVAMFTIATVILCLIGLLAL